MATDLSEICRLCMGRDGVMSRIYKTQTFAMRVMSVAQVEIAEGDGLPTHICRRCFLRVDAAYDFQEVCWTSDLSLKKRFAHVGVNPVPEVQHIEAVFIKHEPRLHGNATDTPPANQAMVISAGTSNYDNVNNTNSQRQDSDPISFESSRDTSLQSSSDEDSDTSETNYLCPNCYKPALSRPTLTPCSTSRFKRRLLYECVSCKKPFRRGELARVVGDSLANASKKRKLTDSAAGSDVNDVRASGSRRAQESDVETIDMAVQTMRASKEPGAYAQLSGNEVDDVRALSSCRAQESDVEKVDVAVQTMRARKEPGAYAQLSGNEVDDVRALSSRRAQESDVEKVDVAVQTMRARKEPGAYAQLSGNEVDDVRALGSCRAQESDVEKVDVAVQTMKARKEPGAYAQLSGNEVDDVRALGSRRAQESDVEKVDVVVQTMRARKEPGAYAQSSGNEVDDVRALSSHRAQESDVEKVDVEKVDVVVQTMKARKEPGAYALSSGNEPTAESNEADCVCKDPATMVDLLKKGFARIGKEMEGMKQMMESTSREVVQLREERKSGLRTALVTRAAVDLPLPLNTLEAFKDFEQELQNKEMRATYMAYLRSLGAKKISDSINRMLRGTFSNQLANLLSWNGTAGKLPLRNSRITRTLFAAVISLGSHADASALDIEPTFKCWITHAKQRIRRMEKRIGSDEPEDVIT